MGGGGGGWVGLGVGLGFRAQGKGFRLSGREGLGFGGFGFQSVFAF